MRRCVAIDDSGLPVAVFRTIKEAAIHYGLLPDRVRKAIVKKKRVLGMRWMYEEEYLRYFNRGHWRKLDLKAPPRMKRPRKTEEAKRKIADNRRRSKEYCKSFFAKSFADYTRYHLEWMRKLKDQFLETKDFGIRPELLADYYTDAKDKEVALLCSLLISSNANCLERVLFFRKVLGEQPWEWFKNRRFVDMRDINVFDRKRIFSFFNSWWEECFKYGSFDSIGDYVLKTSAANCIHPAETMVNTCKEYVRMISTLRIALILLIFSRSDGLGQGLWPITKEQVRIPIVGDLLDFMKTWLPDSNKYGSPDECVNLFGMDSVDFYYCFLAYEKLKKARPKECARYASFYYTAYKSHTPYAWKDWRKVLPEINFSPKSENFL